MAFITFQPKDYFNTKLYTGNATDNRTVTGVGFQPDFTWIKLRNSVSQHELFDAVRGANKPISSNLDAVQSTETNRLKSFDSDGFTLGTGTAVNGSYTFSSWNWKAGTGQGSSNTDGSINTTYTSVNTTAGISISQYTGTGSNATIGHGLGAVPKMIIVKNLTNANAWSVYHASLGATKYLALNETDAAGTASDRWQDTTPTSSVFSIGTNANQGGSYNYIAYCFAEKKGFSKFGSVKGNGSDDGPFIYTGFKPAFYMHKIYNGSTGQWLMFDNKRNESNVVNKFLKTDSNEAEGTSGTANQVDFLSNGIKIRENNGDLNSSTSNDYLYMAFAEHPLVSSNGVPATAR
jgi:hypothetical protein